MKDPTSTPLPKPHGRLTMRDWLGKLGPGLITGAADDDPSGIATYSQAGAQFGLNLLWSMAFIYPLMVGIQVVSARIGRVTGKGLAGNIRLYHPRWLLYLIVGALMLANTFNVDTYFGMGFSNLVAFFIMLTAAMTLNLHGVTNIETSAQAASALRPIAGEFAFLLFAAGIIGTGLLAVPVLAGSAAYAMAGAFNWKEGLEHKPAMAKRFYGIIAVSTLASVALCFAPIDPIKALYWSTVINGVISVPTMAMMMLMAARTDVMGRFVVTRWLKWLGWMATAVMTAAVAAMLVTLAWN